MEIGDPNALDEVNSVIKFCRSALRQPSQNRGGVISKLLAAAEAKRIPILRGKRMNRLPQELLATVFELATVDATSDRMAFTISHVNQEWRSLALRLPRLWAHFFLAYNIDENALEKIACLLFRSKDVPLSLSLLGHRDRWVDVDTKLLFEVVAKVLDIASLRVAIINYLL